MPGTFFGLSIGTSGLYTYQAALNTTAHNVANTNTTGYSRQVVNQVAGSALKVNSTYGMVGSGSNVNGISQIRNQYYDMKYWKNNTTYGEYSAKNYYMTQIEDYFNEINTEGFTTSFDSVFTSLQDLSKDPSSLTTRTQVTNYGQSLAEYFNSLSTSMQSIQEECNFEVKNQVDQINSLAQQIASLTKQINTLEVGGGTANDLRDERALLVDELSGIASVSVTENVVGMGVGVTSYTVKLDGQTLVDTSEYNTLQVIPREDKKNQNDIVGLYDIVWDNGQTLNTESTTLSGTLQALIEVRDGNNNGNLQGTMSANAGDTKVTMTGTNINDISKLNIPSSGVITVGNKEYNYSGFKAVYDSATDTYSYEFTLEEPLKTSVSDVKAEIGDSIDYKGIPYYMSQLNEFVRTFAQEFNSIHRSGQDLNGDSGIDFFNGTDPVTGANYDLDSAETYYNITAANFTVTSEIYSNPSKLAISSSIVDGVENSDVLSQLIALQNDVDMFKQGTPSAFLQTLVADIGVDTSKASNFASSQSNILTMISNQRLSESGVDVDEEAMNLVRFQNAYNLSAKVIQTMDEIYDKLINGMV